MSRALALQALLAASAAAPAAALDTVRLGFGDPAIDARLGGGLAMGALHEFYAPHAADAAAVAGFALLLGVRCDRPGPLVWLCEDKSRLEGRLYGQGLVDMGLDPDRLYLVQAPDTLALLRAAAEVVACAAVAMVVIEPWGRVPALDLNATRRLGLMLARSGVPALLLRSGDAVPSAAQSRWQVGAAPSTALPADAPGHPAFDIRLLRHRGGITGFETRLEWNRDKRAFGVPVATGHGGAALPGAAPAVAAQRARASPARRAA